MNAWQAAGTITVVALALGLALIVPATQHSATTATAGLSTTTSGVDSTGTSTGGSASSSSSSSSTASTGVLSITSTSTTSIAAPGQTSTHADSQSGLQLRLSVNATALTASGETILVNVSEYNTLASIDNVTRAENWTVQSMALSSCPNTNSLPFGIAVYQGHYTAQNVSQGAKLQIFPVTVCPMYIRLVTGYTFQPQSDMATIQPGSGETPILSTLVVNGTYGTPSQPRQLGPGEYTIAAADEWGALAFLYVTVQ